MERFDFSFSPEFLRSYRPIRLLGQGAMGSVHLMHHVGLDLPVAVKFIRSEGFSDNERARFEREAQVLAALNHPNIMAVIDLGMDGRNPYLVCEFVDGGSLAERMYRGPRLTAQQSVKIVAQLLSALRAAHLKDIVHRDIKPANIFLTASLKVKLGDFGLAKPLQAPSDDGRLTVTGAIVGTPAYMSPEQCRGLAATAASDLYSAAIVLYELLTGSRPFHGPGLLEYLLQHTSHEIPPLRSLRPDLPHELEDLLKRALTKRPERRPADAHEFRRELLALAKLLPAAAAETDEDLLNGRYRLQRPVGEGWLGQVYQALDEESGAIVAVKRIRPGLWRDPDIRARIERAAKATPKLQHDLIVRVLSLELERTRPDAAFLVCPFVEGPNLEQELERRSLDGGGPMDAREALPLVTAVVQALGAAHRAGVVHTGLRPSNVLFDERHKVWRVSDFGIDPRAPADATQAPAITSTAVEAYVSPEQRAGDAVDARTDVYALGVLVEQMLTLTSARTVVSGAAPPPSPLPPKLVELLGRCRARTKHVRPASVDAFLDEYRAALAPDEQIPATVVIPPAAKSAPKRLVLGVFALLILVAWIAQKLPDAGPDEPGPSVPATPPLTSPPAPSPVGPSVAAVVTPATPASSAPPSTSPPAPVDEVAALAKNLAAARNETGSKKAEALKWLRHAADSGNVEAQYELAVLLEEGGQTTELNEAGARFKELAERGHAKAQLRLGRMYLAGRGVLRMTDRAAELFRKAAEAGNAAAQWNLAELHASGEGVARDDAEALRWYQAAAAQGDPLGQCGVGLMHELGRGVAADPVGALSWYRRAAQAGHPAGLYHVGLCHLNGVGVAKSMPAALEQLERSAALGHAPAQVALGQIYFESDKGKALSWMKRAAERGDAQAQYLLGEMYLQAGERAQALRWFRAAAEQGQPQARAWLEKNDDR